MKKTLLLLSIVISSLIISCQENLKKAEGTLSETSLESITTDISQNLELSSEVDEVSAKQEEINASEADIEVPMEEMKKESRLSADNFKSIGLRAKLNNTTTETDKAKNCVMIKSTFTIAENTLAAPGNRSVYLQVVKPDGNIFQSRTSNVLRDVDGRDIPYSDKKDVQYNKEAVEVEVYYDLRGEDALKGNYQVNVFCDGNIIGSDNFILR